MRKWAAVLLGLRQAYYRLVGAQIDTDLGVPGRQFSWKGQIMLAQREAAAATAAHTNTELDACYPITPALSRGIAELVKLRRSLRLPDWTQPHRLSGWEREIVALRAFGSFDQRHLVPALRLTYGDMICVYPEVA